MKYLSDIIQNNPLVIFKQGLDEKESRFLFHLIEVHGGIPVKFHPGVSPGKLSTKSVLVLDSFDVAQLKEFKDWGISISCVGRLTESQREKLAKANIVSFWDLDKQNLIELVPVLLKRFLIPYDISLFIWTENKDFIERIKQILWFFSISCLSSSNPDYAITYIEENEPELLILDWDNNGLEINKTIEQLKNVRETKNALPLMIGIKDFSKENLFQDLASGVKEFCMYLFSYDEILKLFLESLPFFALKRDSYFSNQETPYLFGQYSTNRKKNQFEFIKENRNKTQKKNLIRYENDLNLFKIQFEWLYTFL